MAGVLSEGCLDKIASIGVGLAFLVGGGASAATAIGAGELVAQGGIGLGAMGAARVIAGRVREDQTARRVFEKTIKIVREQLAVSGSVDLERLSHVDSQLATFLDRVEFPITDLEVIVRSSAGAGTVHDGLAAAMVVQLTGPVAADLRNEKDSKLARELLAAAVRAGIASSQTIQLEIVQQFCHRGLQEIVQARAEVASEAAATRKVVREEGAASAERHREMLQLLQTAVSRTGVVVEAEIVGIREQAVRDIVEMLGAQGLTVDELVPWLKAWIIETRDETQRLRAVGKLNELEVQDTAMRTAEALMREGAQSSRALEETVSPDASVSMPRAQNRRRLPMPSKTTNRLNSPARIDVDQSANLMTRDDVRVRVEGHFSEIDFVSDRYIFPVGLKRARIRVDAAGGNVNQASIAGKGKSGANIPGGLRLTYLFGREWRIDAPGEHVLHGDPFPEDGLCSIDALDDSVGATVSVVAESADFAIDRERVRPKGIANVLFYELSSIFDPTASKLVQIFLQEALFKRLECEGGDALLSESNLMTRMIADDE